MLQNLGVFTNLNLLLCKNLNPLASRHRMSCVSSDLVKEDFIVMHGRDIACLSFTHQSLISKPVER